MRALDDPVVLADVAQIFRRARARRLAAVGGVDIPANKPAVAPSAAGQGSAVVNVDATQDARAPGNRLPVRARASTTPT